MRRPVRDTRRRPSAVSGHRLALALSDGMQTLKHFMSAHFHQDWFDEYSGSWEDAVDDFVEREPTRIVEALADIDSIRVTSDAELARLLDSIGNYYWPGDAPNAHTVWLSGIRNRLAAAAAGEE
ncbi:MAG: contact-dependent growth inhibition system immunity protein [Nocardioides sp.]|uniref:contact-dependent growth inhibition system immunity protein n=1 Tax=Nocardioides sp. TaxID=35761 RepID=UPI003262F65D